MDNPLPFDAFHAKHLAICDALKPAPWAPPALLDMFRLLGFPFTDSPDDFGISPLQILKALTTEPNARFAWEKLSQVDANYPASTWKVYCWTVEAYRPLSPWENMTPAERAELCARVEKQARKLLETINGTRFDQTVYAYTHKTVEQCLMDFGHFDEATKRNYEYLASEHAGEYGVLGNYLYLPTLAHILDGLIVATRRAQQEDVAVKQPGAVHARRRKFAKMMSERFCEHLGGPLHGVTASLYAAITGEDVTEHDIREATRER